MERLSVILVAVLGVVWLGMSGCVVTQSSVKKQIDERVGEVEKQVDANQQEIASLKQDQLQSLQQKQEETLTLSSNAMEMGEEALARAEEAGKVAEGKLLYQVTFTDEAVHFGFDKRNLSKEAKKAIDDQFAPDAYNIGINDGETAGQTIPHLHVHLIPRYKGDSKDPRGGVRWVIPEKARYWDK